MRKLLALAALSVAGGSAFGMSHLEDTAEIQVIADSRPHQTPATMPSETTWSPTTHAPSTPSVTATPATSAVVAVPPTSRAAGTRASSSGPTRAASPTSPPSSSPATTVAETIPPTTAYQGEYNVDPTGLRWNPCRTITWTIDPSGNTKNWPTDNHPRAVARMGQATGLTFAEVPFGQPADITFKWRPINYQNSIGYGSSQNVGGWKGNGVVIIDPDRTHAYYGLLLHELGHVIGIDHVASRREIMGNTRLPDFGPGDLRGLAIVGKQEGECA